MNSDDIKKTWCEIGNRLQNPNTDEIDTIMVQKKETALEALVKKYKHFSRFGLIMMVVSINWFSLGERMGIGDSKYILAVLYAVYFLTSSCMDYWLYTGVKGIDCFTMSVREVSEKALYYKKKHLQSMILMIPFMLIVLGYTFYCCAGEKYFLFGMATGALLGVAIGYRQYIDFMRQYKVLSD